MKLGVNVDHVATLREARGTVYPDPIVGALLAEYAGCDSIVMHLREDRRHIKERDIIFTKKALEIPFNLEMSVNKSIVDFALNLLPDYATLVPEKRQELTTEGGIDLKESYLKVSRAVGRLKSKGIKVSLFIDPLKRQIDLAKRIGADSIELNTGGFSESKTERGKKNLCLKIKEAAEYAKDKGFFVAAGHGLDYVNVKDIVKIRAIEELNIGHSIISRSIFLGLVTVVEEMITLIRR